MTGKKLRSWISARSLSISSMISRTKAWSMIYKCTKWRRFIECQDVERQKEYKSPDVYTVRIWKVMIGCLQKCGDADDVDLDEHIPRWTGLEHLHQSSHRAILFLACLCFSVCYLNADALPFIIQFVARLVHYFQRHQHLRSSASTSRSAAKTGPSLCSHYPLLDFPVRLFLFVSPDVISWSAIWSRMASRPKQRYDCVQSPDSIIPSNLYTHSFDFQNNFASCERRVPSHLALANMTNICRKPAFTLVLAVTPPSIKRTTSLNLVAAGPPTSTQSRARSRDTRIAHLECNGPKSSAATAVAI